MLEKELILRLLRLNLVPCPRVIVPGPATRFPVIWVGPSGEERTIGSLEEARAIFESRSRGASGERRSGEARSGESSYFREPTPQGDSVRIMVDGYSASLAGGPATPDCGRWEGPWSEAMELAVRAAYCLGLRAAEVSVVLGAGRPMVTDVRGSSVRDSSRGDGPERPDSWPRGRSGRGGVRFLGADVEYAVLDAETGDLLRAFEKMRFGPSSETLKEAFEETLDSGCGKTRGSAFGSDLRRVCGSAPGVFWVSSPMPLQGVPLTTRLAFRGIPEPDFVHTLDAVLAVLGMLVAPADEARERHATDEGLLGSLRCLRGGSRGVSPSFEYLCVPSLLWSPSALLGIVTLADVVARHPCEFRDLSRLLGMSLEERYRLQSAYYRAEKRLFENAALAAGDAMKSIPLTDSERRRIEAFLNLCLEEAQGGARGEERGEPRGEQQGERRGEARGESRGEPRGPGGAADALDSEWPLKAPSHRDFRRAWGIEVDQEETRTVVVSGEEWLDLPREVLVRAGDREARACVKPAAVGSRAPRSPDWAYAGTLDVRPGLVLSPELLLPSGFSYRSRLQVCRTASESLALKIGPVLGILAPDYGGPQRFGIETDRFKKIVKVAEARGVLAYVFFPERSVHEDHVWGWLWREKRGWILAQLPVPDVVYDRYIPDVLPGGSISPIRDVSREFQEAHPGVRFINSLEFVRACRDKLAAYSILSQDPLVREHLPETEAVRSAGQAALFASKRPRTFVKLRGGTGSTGLVVVENLGDRGSDGEGHYRVVSLEKDGTTSEMTVVGPVAGPGCSELERLLVRWVSPSGVLGDGGAEYIVQQGIDLAEGPEPGQTFEVRVVCQKGGAGIWLRTGMACRVGRSKGRFIIPRRESHAKAGDILERVFPGRSEAIKQEIRRIARRVPRALELGSARGGEVSVDLGIDKQGKPWIIEVNSKPATLFRDIGAFGLRQLSLVRIVDYAIALHDQENDQPSYCP